jgi:hypothetical protein
MKGDFTRDSFQPQKHFTSVRAQQGRVPLDADFNEAQDIAYALDVATREDTIGPSGVPQSGGGFRLSVLAAPGGQDIALSPGRIYVDGVLAVNEPGRAIAATLINATTLGVASDRLEGAPLAVGQWVEVWSGEGAPQPLRIASVTPQASGVRLGVEPAIADSASLTAPRLRRLRTLLTQPDYPAFGFPAAPLASANQLPTTDGTYLAYLDVWSRHITALEDPSIQEIALGGPDTATRLKTLAQVKLLPLEASADFPPACGDFGPGWSPTPPSTARLRGRAQPDPQADRPCLVPARAGYRRQENQLYRVEIHRGGDASTATFKWSRDNGTLLSAWSGPDDPNTATLRVDSLGPDAVRRFRADQWVELSDDTRDLHNQPGPLLRLIDAVDDTLTLAGSVTRIDFPERPKVRGWDHQATVARPATGDDIPLALVEGAVPVREGDWIVLEDGVQVFFEPGGTYAAGDHWLIPARTIDGDVLWPRDDDGAPLAEPPLGIAHHYCALGLLRREGGTWQVDIPDCRRPFPPLTDLVNIQSCGEIVVRPEDDLQAVFDRIPTDGSARLCFHPGVWTLATPVTVANRGSLVLSGAGAATQLIATEVDRVLRFVGCASVTLRDLAVQGGAAGATGDGLGGSLSFENCGTVALEQVQVACGGHGSRRVSAVAVQRAGEVAIRHCRVLVGQGQVGLLLVNGDRLAIDHNAILAGGDRISLGDLVADPATAAAVGRLFIDRIRVGRANLDTTALEQLDRGDFGLGDPVETLPTLPNAQGQHRLLAVLTRWGPHPFTFATDQQLSPRAWTEILEANPVLPASGGPMSVGVVGTRLRQLRARLARRLLGDSGVEVTIPRTVRGLLEELTINVQGASALATGSQGIVIAGDRTPFFGASEPYGNGLFMVGGDTAPSATVTHNQITGFAEGIHIGTSNDTSKYHRSYHLQLTGNTIELHAAPLAAERHGIFVGHAHTVKILDNLIQVVQPSPSDWNRPRRGSRLPPLPPTDGIRLYGVYGPLLQIRQNHCIGPTLGISVNARHAGRHEERIGVRPAWRVVDNAYAGFGTAERLVSTPSDRFTS